MRSEGQHRRRSASSLDYSRERNKRRNKHRRRSSSSYDSRPSSRRHRKTEDDTRKSHRKRAFESDEIREKNESGRKSQRRRHRRHSSSVDSSYRQSPAEISDDDVEATCELNIKRSTKRSYNSHHDDSIGHFRGGPGTVIAGRYRVVRDVGLGTFGRVVECCDLRVRDGVGRGRNRPTHVAIKVVRSIKRYYDSALIEARVIQDINRRGGRGLSHCVILHDDFTFDGHFCMVFETLGPSLYDFMKSHNYQPFPMACIQDFTVQLLETLEFLHSFRLIHTDMKLENILTTTNREVLYANQFVPASTRIKVIDFGGASYDSEKKSMIINTRQYRGPEVILGTGWSMPSDLWSVGCILAELYQGELLFGTHDDVEHLALMESMISRFPRWMLRKSLDSGSDLVNLAFDSCHRHRFEAVLSPQSASFVRKARSLEAIVGPNDTWFLELLRRLLVIDPNERATAHEALRFLSRRGRAVVWNA